MSIQDTVFVSYSHRDLAARQRTEPALRNTVEDALWIDQHRLDYGDRFDDKIRDALARSRVGILLISPHFFNSDYIKSKELPFLVECAERGDLFLGIVFLTATPTKPLSVAVRIEADIREIPLHESYHCFTTPNEPLDTLPEAQQNRVFAEIADWASRKLELSLPREGEATGHSALAIRLRRHGSVWDRQYVLPDRHRPQPPPTEADPAAFHPRGALGETMFAALFGSDGHYHGDLFGTVFGTGKAVHPTYAGLRVQLLLEDNADDNELALAPWSEMTWQGKKLTECGWCVELRTAGSKVEYPDLIHHTMDFPDRVVALAGDGFSDSPHLEEDLRRFFDHHWQSHVPYVHCSGVDSFEAALAGSPRLVYYLGPADEAGLRLSGETLFEWPRLAGCLGQAGTVSLLYLNLPDAAAVDAIAAARPLLDAVRAAVLLHCSDHRLQAQAQGNAMAWLRAVLLEESDPIAALHGARSGPVYAWSRYTRWGVREPGEPDDPDFVNLFLDREKQRHKLAGAKNDFLQSNRVGRVHHVVAYGEKGNLCGQFPRAVMNYLRDGLAPGELCFLATIRLDGSLDGGVDGIETAVRRSLGWRPGSGVETALLPGGSNPGPEMFCYVVLHWHLQAPFDDAEAARPLLEGIADWTAMHLVDAIAEAEARAKLNIRIISIATVEGVDLETADDFEPIVEDLQDKTFANAAFHFGELDRLTGVRKNDFKRFFHDDRRCRCSDKHREKFPALLLGSNRELRFDLAVETIRRRFPDNLGGLFQELEQLVASNKWPPEPEESDAFWKHDDAQ